jgi:hypothetical protein
MRELTHLEQSVLHAVLAGDHPVLDALRDQLEGLAVAGREVTATSFTTALRPAHDAGRAPVAARQAVLDDLYADVPGLAGGISFALFVEDGRLSCLRGSTFDGEPWPADLAGFTLHLVDPERDLSDLDPPA